MVTVHDVASRSGVSIATVSRTLRAPDRVAPETRERVLEAVRDLGYRPNRAASGLRGGRTGVIGLVVPDIVNPYFATLTKGAQLRCRERGYGLVVVDTTESADVEAAELDALAPQIDGIVLASSRLDDDRLARVAASTPCVLVNRSLDADGETIPAVMLDERHAADEVFRYLTGLGHTHVAYVGGPARSWSQARRSAAMREAAASFGADLVELGPVTPDVLGATASPRPPSRRARPPSSPTTTSSPQGSSRAGATSRCACPSR
ncbi:LacI family transcriptional regulator [Agromyces protaetiae]|uniref:LacI family transcriptional regulator n=1 Tax=Agromyces protaetiae TaxID=2509455 RepID=A0A4P6F9L3_9MICO|nr:LacI family transcriptional regulator [Agromyces protaetiae]